MRIPTREEQARYGALNAHDTTRFNVQERTPNASLQINADMFGAGQAKALGEASRNLKQLGQVGAHWYIKDQEVKGEDSYNKMLQEANEGLYGKDGILMQKGEAGKDAAEKAKTFLTSISDKYSKNLSDAAHNSFMDRTQRFATHTMTRAHVHAAQEEKEWNINVHKATEVSSKDNALRNAANPEAFDYYTAEHLQAVTLEGQARGLPPEAIDVNRKAALSGLYMDKVQGLITGGDLKGAKAAASSGRLMEQDRIRALGVIKQEEKRLQAEARLDQAHARSARINASTSLYMNRIANDEDLSAVQTDIMKNVDPQLRGDVLSQVNMQTNILNNGKRQQREDHANNLLTTSVNMALGTKGAPPDPVAALNMVRDDQILDGKTKVDFIKTLESGTLGKQDDPDFVNDMTMRIVNSQGNIADNEILTGFASGKMKSETKDRMLKLKEQAIGPQKEIIKFAHSAINEAFSKNMLADGTPEFANAKFSAQAELNRIIGEAEKRGDLDEILNPNSPKYILPAILSRHQLSMQDMQKAMMKKMSPDLNVQGKASVPINDYLKTIGRNIDGTTK